jgi:SH3-like domain-containing protein
MRYVRIPTAFVALACVVVLSLIALPLVAAEYVSVTNDNVNVRTGPGTDHQIAMELFAGYPLEVTGKQGDWLKIVDFEKDAGWIHNSLVESGSTVIVNATTSANMRAEPSTTSPVIATVERGVVMSRLESQGEWLKLSHSSGLTGWIHKSLLWP